MRRGVAASAVVRSLVAGPLTGPAAVGSAKLDQFSCRRSPQPHRRSISVQAVMRHRDGTQRMAMRFELLWTAPGRHSSYNEHAGSLGRWRHPTHPPTLGQRPKDVWRVTQKVRNLASNGTYRFRVEFKWTGAGGSTLYETSLLRPRCREG